MAATLSSLCAALPISTRGFYLFSCRRRGRRGEAASVLYLALTAVSCASAAAPQGGGFSQGSSYGGGDIASAGALAGGPMGPTSNFGGPYMQTGGPVSTYGPYIARGPIVGAAPMSNYGYGGSTGVGGLGQGSAMQASGGSSTGALAGGLARRLGISDVTGGAPQGGGFSQGGNYGGGDMASAGALPGGLMGPTSNFDGPYMHTGGPALVHRPGIARSPNIVSGAAPIDNYSYGGSNGVGGLAQGSAMQGGGGPSTGASAGGFARRLGVSDLPGAHSASSLSRPGGSQQMSSYASGRQTSPGMGISNSRNARSDSSLSRHGRSQQTSSYSSGRQTASMTASSWGTDTAAPAFFPHGPGVSAATAATAAAHSTGLLLAPPVHAVAYPVALPAVSAFTAGPYIPPSPPHFSSPAPHLSVLPSASGRLSGQASSHYGGSTHAVRNFTTSGLQSSSSAGHMSHTGDAGGSANGTSDASSGLGGSRLLVSERGAAKGAPETHAPEQQSAGKTRPKDRIEQYTRESKTAPRKLVQPAASRTRRQCDGPRCMLERTAPPLRRLSVSRRGCHGTNLPAPCEAGEKVGRARRPSLSERAQNKNASGVVMRRLAQQVDTSKDIISNEPQPAALNYGYLRGFGRPQQTSFFDRRSRTSGIPVSEAGYPLVQYTSNVELPLWGPIPNFPQNFSSL